MSKCERNAVGSLVLDKAAVGGGGAGGLRFWPLFSAAAFRRRLVDALICGVSRHRRKKSSATTPPTKLGKEKPLPAPPPPSDSKRHPTSDKLSELLKVEISESGSDEAEAETRRKVEIFEELQGVVTRLQIQTCGHDDGEDDVDDKVKIRKARLEEAAKDVRRLAKEDPEARETLAMLGAIPPLVGMLDSSDSDLLIPSLYALLNLAIGNDMNKAAIVAAGAVHKMLSLISCGNSPPAVSEAIVANFLGLTALDANKPIIGASGAIPFLVGTFRNPNQIQPRHDALRALFNLSISSSNIPFIVESGLVPDLIAAIGDMVVTERVLGVLSNVVSTAEGRRVVSRSADVFHILIDVLNWSDSPRCQEAAAYVLMVMAHKAYTNRTAMIEAGVVSSLLELTLLGTALAQKRASRILECLRVDKGKQVSEGFEGPSGCSGGPAVSAPLFGGGGASAAAEEEAGMSEEKRAVKQLVQQSLQNNMRRIVRRANLPQDFAPSDHFRTLTTTATSKSLPF